jgi:hypothetical protein
MSREFKKPSGGTVFTIAHSIVAASISTDTDVSTCVTIDALPGSLSATNDYAKPSDEDMRFGWNQLLTGLWKLNAFSELSYADFEGSNFKKCLITFLAPKGFEVSPPLESRYLDKLGTRLIYGNILICYLEVLLYSTSWYTIIYKNTNPKP